MYSRCTYFLHQYMFKRSHMCACGCEPVCIYECMFVLCPYLRMCTCMCICMYMYMRVYEYLHPCMYLIQICMYAWIYVWVCIYVFTVETLGRQRDSMT